MQTEAKTTGNSTDEDEVTKLFIFEEQKYDLREDIDFVWNNWFLFKYQSITFSFLCRDQCRIGLPLGTPNFPPGTHDYDPRRHHLIEGVSKCMISRQEAHAKFSIKKRKDLMMKSTLMAPKWTKEWGAAVVINRDFQNGETTCRQLSKRLLDNSTIFAAETTAISVALNYYQHMGPVHHDVVVHSDSIFCLQAIEGEDTENPLIRHIMNLLWLLSDRGTHVRFCWIPSHCGIEGNERVDQLANDTLNQEIDPLAGVHYIDLKPLVNSYIQSLVQTKWGVAVHGRDMYLMKPTLGQPKKFQRLTRAEEIVITRLPMPISCPEDHPLLVTTVVKHSALITCSWSVQWYRNVVINTTQLTHWIPSSRQFPKHASWNSCETWDCSIWYEQSLN